MSSWVKLEPNRRQVAIAGIVIDEQTQQPLMGANVQITDAPEQFLAQVRLSALQGRRLNQSATTRDGWFYFINLPSGSYTLTASLPNAAGRYQASNTTIAIVPPSEAIPPSTTAAQPTWTQLSLCPTTLKGMIQDQKQQAIVMAKVWIEGSAAFTFSDSKGQYLLTPLEGWDATTDPKAQPPTMTVKVTAPGYEVATQEITLRQGEITTLTIRLQQILPIQ